MKELLNKLFHAYEFLDLRNIVKVGFAANFAGLSIVCLIQMFVIHPDFPFRIAKVLQIETGNVVLILYSAHCLIKHDEPLARLLQGRPATAKWCSNNTAMSFRAEFRVSDGGTKRRSKTLFYNSETSFGFAVLRSG
jgi:hypothetical protein